VIGIVREKLQQPNCRTGSLLDGFPRNLEQAESLDKIFGELSISMDAVFDIEVPDEELVQRLTGRRVCRQCATTYHLKNNPPKVRNICDHCGGELSQRADDTIDTVRERLEIYHKETAPLIEFYRKKGILYEIDGNREINEVLTEIETILKGLQ